MASKKKGGKGKMNADKRTMNPGGGPPRAPAQRVVGGDQSDQGASFEQQDVKRRLGQFGGAGEHPIMQNKGMASG
jgi:hypothetical protein